MVLCSHVIHLNCIFAMGVMCVEARRSELCASQRCYALMSKSPLMRRNCDSRVQHRWLAHSSPPAGCRWGHIPNAQSRTPGLGIPIVQHRRCQRGMIDRQTDRQTYTNTRSGHYMIMIILAQIKRYNKHVTKPSFDFVVSRFVGRRLHQRVTLYDVLHPYPFFLRLLLRLLHNIRGHNSVTASSTDVVVVIVSARRTE